MLALSVQPPDDASTQLLQPAERDLLPPREPAATRAEEEKEDIEDEQHEERLPLSVSEATTQTASRSSTSLAAGHDDDADIEALASAALQPFSLDTAAASEGGEDDEVVRLAGLTSGGIVINCSRELIVKAVLVSLLLFSTFMTVYIYLYSWIVLIVHGRDPCDVPLAPWLLLYLLMVPLYLLSSRWQPWVNRVLCQWAPESSDSPPPLRVKLLAWLFTFFGYYVLFFQMGLVKQAKTCKQSAPVLYGWVAYLAPTGVVHLFVLGLLMSCSLTALVMIMRASMDAPRPADPCVIRQLDTVVMELTPDDERQCSICLDGYSEGQRAKITPCCRNVFHKACLKKWLKHRRTCPLCREDLQEAVQLNSMTGP